MSERWRRHRPRPLSIEEVEAAGLPARFSAFGDDLVFRDGVVYALPDGAYAEADDPERLLGTYVVTERVGIEYGWRHEAGCLCPFCAPEADRRVA